jgi:hypothetical protein
MLLPRTDQIRKDLLSKRAEAIEFAYDEEPEPVHLSEEEFRYLTGLISSANVTEEDVELALALVTEDEEHANRLAQLVFTRYPHLIKNLYAHLNASAYEGSKLWGLLLEVAKNKHAHEFVLFWCVRIVIELYAWDGRSANLLLQYYDHPGSTDAVKAAILECEYLNFGLLERKEAMIRDGGASLLGISAAVGLRALERGMRNQLYDYSAASSPVMREVTNALKRSKQNS